MTDDELRDKQFLNESSYNGCFTGDCPHSKIHDCMYNVYKAGWSTRGEHIAEHPKVKRLIALLKVIKLDSDIEAEQIIDEALKAFEEK
jgi:hypothetical protein